MVIKKLLKRKMVLLWSVPLLVLALTLGVWNFKENFAAEGKPIVIGVSLSATGRYADTGKYQQEACLLWEEIVNKRGGLLGRPVKFIVYDDQSDPTRGAQLFEKLITQDNVDLVLGPYSSAVTQAVSTVTEKYKFPMVAGGASADELWQRGYKYIFGVYTPAPAYFEGMIEILAKEGIKTMAVVNEDSLFPKSTVKGAIEMAEKQGIKIVFREEYPVKATDVSSLLLKAKAANPDVLLGGSYLPDSLLIHRQAKDLNLNPKVFTYSVGPALPEFYQEKEPRRSEQTYC